MRPVLLMRYRGFLLRVVDNGSKSHPYEWTYEGIAPSTDSKLREANIKHQASMNKRLSHRKRHETYYEGQRRKCHQRRDPREHDPTSMRTSRGNCSALYYGKQAIDEFVSDRRPYLYKLNNGGRKYGESIQNWKRSHRNIFLFQVTRYTLTSQPLKEIPMMLP